MQKIADTAIRMITSVSAAVAMLAMSAVVLMLALNILGRPFGHSISGIDDLTAVALVGVFSFGLAAAVGLNAHISIDILTNRLPADTRYYLARCVEVLTVMVAIYLTSGVYRLTANAYRSNQMMLGALPIPRYLPMGILLAGLIMFTIALLLVVIRNLSARK